MALKDAEIDVEAEIFGVFLINELSILLHHRVSQPCGRMQLRLHHNVVFFRIGQRTLNDLAPVGNRVQNFVDDPQLCTHAGEAHEGGELDVADQLLQRFFKRSFTAWYKARLHPVTIFDGYDMVFLHQRKPFVQPLVGRMRISLDNSIRQNFQTRRAHIFHMHEDIFQLHVYIHHGIKAVGGYATFRNFFYLTHSFIPRLSSQKFNKHLGLRSNLGVFRFFQSPRSNLGAHFSNALVGQVEHDVKDTADDKRNAGNPQEHIVDCAQRSSR